ncbi:hypothetical protein GLA29479_3462 [Lysobacter antibioticus]|nr:hypothetical protein GLA29479_3462 [Lysobacter antibioticus]
MRPFEEEATPGVNTKPERADAPGICLGPCDKGKSKCPRPPFPKGESCNESSPC